MNANSVTESKWNEILVVSLTAEQRAILESSKSSDAQKIKVMQYIQDNSQKPLTDASVLEVLNAEYAKLKPVLSEDDDYKLIACDIFLSNDLEVIGSILNYRVDGEQKQVRG